MPTSAGLRRGHCTDCAESVFRSVSDPLTNELIPLWPNPRALFAVVWSGSDSEVPGVAYCEHCAPDLGTDAEPSVVSACAVALVQPEDALRPTAVVMGYETAGTRHAICFQPTFGVWLKGWLEQHCRMDETAVAAMMRQWEQDVEAVTG